LVVVLEVLRCKAMTFVQRVIFKDNTQRQFVRLSNIFGRIDEGRGWVVRTLLNEGSRDRINVFLGLSAYDEGRGG